MTVEVLQLDPDLPLPAYARPGDAGADLCGPARRDPGPRRRTSARTHRRSPGHTEGLRRLSSSLAAAWPCATE